MGFYKKKKIRYGPPHYSLKSKSWVDKAEEEIKERGVITKLSSTLSKRKRGLKRLFTYFSFISIWSILAIAVFGHTNRLVLHEIFLISFGYLMSYLHESRRN